MRIAQSLVASASYKMFIDAMGFEAPGSPLTNGSSTDEREDMKPLVQSEDEE